MTEAGRYGRKTMAGILLLLCLGLGWTQAAARTSIWHGTVTYVTDGDTLWVQADRGGPSRKIRLDGIDAPEICQRHGAMARDALAQQVLGQSVRVDARRRDDYDRLLAKISLQGQDVGAWMVLQGHAWSYRYRHSAGPYAGQETQARTRGLGLFADPGAERPRSFRLRHGSCH